CACDRCSAEDHPWFLKRFNKSVNPFLTRENNLSAEVYDWWKNLQSDKSNLSTYTKLVEEVFDFFPIGYSLVDRPSDRCRACAVVGNSGNLRGSHYGSLIDIHDVVIRMNGARTEGFEADVGSRTTLHIMYPESAVDLADTTHLVLFPYKTLDIRWLISAFTTGSIRSNTRRINANKNLVMVLNPAFMKYVYENWLERKGRYPSTGFLALMLGLHICDEVSVFGYGADKDGNWNHYWEELRNKHLGSGVHGGKSEYNLIQLLFEQQKLEYFRGH
ncbi:CMP-N-acetylneuraminate-beta-galactosamide-alpha-2,3-sialyltransferase 1-like, partial [Lampris incognitus]|uniref:CMP-N-acetylneuraminate-beta-galactosamide- alpha-2,3-sialyltransferase 1-like n=1 Tax=Lampris incognitus TaxID=2546036 RepID=UPI0024B4CE70